MVGPGRANPSRMIHVQVKSEKDPQALADLIASTQSDEAVIDQKLAVEATLLRHHQQQAEAARPSRQELDTVDFAKLDADNDWTDL